jgi:hypothetical protein
LLPVAGLLAGLLLAVSRLLAVATRLLAETTRLLTVRAGLAVRSRLLRRDGHLLSLKIPALW